MSWQQLEEERRVLISARRDWRRCRQAEKEARLAYKACQKRTRAASEKVERAIQTIESRQGIFAFEPAAEPPGLA